MITRRQTRLVRARDLRAMQHGIVAALPSGWEARDAAVIVPTRSAAEALRQTMEDLVLRAAGALVPPNLVTRAGFYGALHERAPGLPPLLTDFEREVLLRLSAEDAAGGGAEAPFRLRPGLVAAMLAFYDELRRRRRTIDSFDRHLRERLEAGSETDRGAARLLAQTLFLSSAFASFERRVADSGGLDEHGLRALALARDLRCPYRHVVVAVADEAADPLGLWPCDFDLLARVEGLERLEVVATERMLASGWHERVHDLLPGIEEVKVESVGVPVLLVPAERPGMETAPYFVARDREEELMEAARWIKA
ncbi:MAG TPA: hypothetical protein VLC53_07465, partial [Myxococcota bacterium]|nr:hypothetical protein [Myxococcota bacterium]